ncbi:MAG: hypothetical protein P8R02_02000 [Pseudomonadales bacterium]|nr:hypothetical protein [Pseudomonadales bacterium]
MMLHPNSRKIWALSIGLATLLVAFSMLYFVYGRYFATSQLTRMPVDVAEKIVSRDGAGVSKAVVAESPQYNQAEKPVVIWSEEVTGFAQSHPERGPMSQFGKLVSLQSKGLLRENAQIEIKLPQGPQSYLGVITKAITNTSSTSYQGELLEEAGIFPFTITVGDGQYYVSMSTPAGLFEATGNADFAWVYPSNAMAKALQGAPDDFKVHERRELVPFEQQLPKELTRPLAPANSSANDKAAL